MATYSFRFQKDEKLDHLVVTIEELKAGVAIEKQMQHPQVL
jgi:hypothetical protein